MTFEITEKEEQAAKEFMEKHNCGPIFLKGQRIPYASLSYIITPGAIGYGVDVRCNKCGKTKDITDYDTW